MTFPPFLLPPSHHDSSPPHMPHAGRILQKLSHRRRVLACDGAQRRLSFMAGEPLSLLSPQFVSLLAPHGHGLLQLSDLSHGLRPTTAPSRRRRSYRHCQGAATRATSLQPRAHAEWRGRAALVLANLTSQFFATCFNRHKILLQPVSRFATTHSQRRSFATTSVAFCYNRHHVLLHPSRPSCNPRR